MFAFRAVVKLTTTWRHREPETFIDENVVVVIMAHTSWTRTAYSKAQRDARRCVVKTVTDEGAIRSGFRGMALRLFYGFHRRRTRYSGRGSSALIALATVLFSAAFGQSVSLFVYLSLRTHIWQKKITDQKLMRLDVNICYDKL